MYPSSSWSGCIHKPGSSSWRGSRLGDRVGMTNPSFPLPLPGQGKAPFALLQEARQASAAKSKARSRFTWLETSSLKEMGVLPLVDNPKLWPLSLRSNQSLGEDPQFVGERMATGV